MRRSTAFILAGAGLGFATGSSMGIAVGGTAYNAALFFTPTGAFVGWLLASRGHTVDEKCDERQSDNVSQPEYEPSHKDQKLAISIRSLVFSLLAILAAVWNFHIELLETVGILPAFVRQPLLFVGLCVVFSVMFPPFLAIYFFAWLGASHFGLSEENQYRAIIR